MTSSAVSAPLEGKRILVTGGATGIGAAAVCALSTAGAAVVATYHSTAPPEDLNANWLQCDVRDPAMVAETFRKAVEALLDILKALPADVVIGLEVPRLSLAEAGVSHVDRMRTCVEAARGLLTESL